MSGREAIMAETIGCLGVGRRNAVSITTVRRRLLMLHPWPNKSPAPSTTRARIHELQAAGFRVLSSPRHGVWIAADDGEVLDMLDELRVGIAALEARMQLINGGKCALRSCRVELSDRVVRRRGLYCCPDHRYRAAIARAS